jgi:hypothetical protein
MNVLNKAFKTKIKSGNLSTDYIIENVMKDIKKFQLNTINIPVVVNIEAISSSDMHIDKNSKEKAIKLIKKLKGTGVSVILEPYPWIENGSKAETEWKPKDINMFFCNWKEEVLKVLINDIAVPYKVDAFIVASSFVYMEYKEEEWCNIIDYVRKNYKGLITYRTSWWSTASWEPKLEDEFNKKLNNKLFSKIDFVSIASYFELTEDEVNSVENLVSALESTQIYNRKQNVKAQIKAFNDKWNKPIFFGELGFPKTDKASVFPWNPYASDNKNDTEQAKCFEAYRRVFEKEPWFLGFSIFAIGEDSEDKRYYPSNESTNIIINWFKD